MIYIKGFAYGLTTFILTGFVVLSGYTLFNIAIEALVKV